MAAALLAAYPAVFAAGGAAMAQQHLPTVLAYLDVPTLGQPEAFIQAKDGVFDEAGGIGLATYCQIRSGTASTARR